MLAGRCQQPQPSAPNACPNPLQREGRGRGAAPPPEKGAGRHHGGAGGLLCRNASRGCRLLPPHGVKSTCGDLNWLHPGTSFQITYPPTYLERLLCPAPSLPLLLPDQQEEEVRNRASEGLNVAKLSLEGRIRELQGAVETQHQVCEGGGEGGVVAASSCYCSVVRGRSASLLLPPHPSHPTQLSCNRAMWRPRESRRPFTPSWQRRMQQRRRPLSIAPRGCASCRRLWCRCGVLVNGGGSKRGQRCTCRLHAAYTRYKCTQI